MITPLHSDAFYLFLSFYYFCTKENEYIYIDSTKYLFINKKGEDYTKAKEVIHNFGFTPVRQLWTSNLSKNRFLVFVDKFVLSFIKKDTVFIII